MRTLLAIFMLCIASFAANSVYLAPSSAGGNTGLDCADAKAASYFNSSGNWSATPTGIQIGPGTTVNLCSGTYTVSSGGTLLQFQGSGSVGNPVTVLGVSGVNITSVAMGAGIDLNSKNYIVIDGGVACGPGTACNSGLTGTTIIQNTANGTGLANQLTSFGVHAGYNSGSPFGTCGHDIEIRNLLILNMYVRNGTVDNSVGDGGLTPFYSSGDTQFVGCGVNISMHDMTGTNGHTGFGAIPSVNGAVNHSFYNLAFVGGVWGVNFNCGGSGNCTTAYIYGNDISLGTTWQNTGDTNPNHVDPIIVYGQNGTVFPSYVYVYNNYIHSVMSNGQTGACPTGLIFLDQNVDHAYVFNNQLELDGITYGCNGNIATGPANSNNFVYNNTIVGNNNATAQAIGSLGTEAAVLTAENNVVSTINGFTDMRDAGNGAVQLEDYNVFYNLSGTGSGGVPGIWCSGLTSPQCFNTNFATWKACGTCTVSGAPDAHSSTSNPNLAGSYPYTIQNTSSSAYQTGVNLYSVCNGQPNPGLGALCFDAAGVARPTSAAWDMGALQYQAAGPPPAMRSPCPACGVAENWGSELAGSSNH